MLEALRFVQGAVAKKDYHPALTNFRIHEGHVQGYNGVMALSSPIELALNVVPSAVEFLRAIRACDGTIAIHQTPGGRLAIKSGTFKTFVECSGEVFPAVTPVGVDVALPGNLIPALKVLAPFIATDASRTWAQGVLFRGMSAFATNNVVLVEHWLGYPLPFEINLPKPAVTELLRIGEEPERIQLAASTCTFHFSGGRWLHTSLYETSWPKVETVLGAESTQAQCPQGLWEALEQVAPFVDKTGRVYLAPGKLFTSSEEEVGAAVDLPSLEGVTPSIYHLGHLMLLRPITQTIDFSTYPRPCLFEGDNLRGAILGMRA